MTIWTSHLGSTSIGVGMIEMFDKSNEVDRTKEQCFEGRNVCSLQQHDLQIFKELDVKFFDLFR